MRRTLACLTLALLVAFPAVAPVAASDPTSGPTPTAPPSVDPTAPPSVDPTVLPSPEPSAEPSLDPTAPTPPSADPSLDPTAPPSPSSATATKPDMTRGRPDPTGRYIVVLRGTASPLKVANRHRQIEGTRVIRRFDSAVRGFTAELDPAQRAALQADPNVVAVVPDEVIELTAQTVPNGVKRIGGRYSTVAAVDGVDQRVDADVAIVDTGIAKVADLNVAGGYNCSTSDRTKWRDVEGHGTHVAGTVGALDNDIGVVGVAPGARLWAVKILNDDGYGLLSWYVCGLDWILAQRDPKDASRPLFEAVNMSVTKWGSDDHACGAENDDILHAAICRVVAGGITVVAAAANDSGSASKRVPASYNEVITVSALADTDGKPGGTGGNSCYSWGTYDKDDTFANFSNYGGDVDLIAPGKCIWSTKPGNTYAYSSGTSMAAPAVTGAVALYKASRPNATPAEVKEALQYLGNLDWNLATDPDATHEKLLDVSRIGKLGTFGFATPSATAHLGEDGGTVTASLRLTRSSTFFERVRLATVDLPSGWSASFAPSSLLGWATNSSTVTLTVPAGLAAGTYDITISGTNQGRRATTVVPVVIDNDDPTAFEPTAVPAKGERVGVGEGGVPTEVSVLVSWPAATDPSSPIGGYELEHRTDGGEWEGTIETGATTRSALVKGLDLTARQQFRVRARDTIGNWSPWVSSIEYTFRAVGDRSASLTYAGAWKRAPVASATNAVRTTSTRAGASVSYTFTGRGVAVVMPRSTVRGRVTVYIDGVKAATVDTRHSTVQARRVVWAKRWSTSARHTIRIRVNGTAGRPTVSLDGLIITK